MSRIGGDSSMANLVMMTGSFFGALAFGPLGDRFGYDKPLMATGVLAILLALPLALRRSDAVIREHGDDDCPIHHSLH